MFEPKNPIVNVRTIEKKEEQHVHNSPEKIYDQLKVQYKSKVSEMRKNANSKGYEFKLNTYGRKNFLFPLIEKEGFTSWKSLEDEMLLIDEKKSKASSLVRGAINHLHTHCLITYLNLKKNENKKENI